VTLRYPSYLRDCYDTIASFIRTRRPDAAIVHRATAAGVSHWLGATRMAESAAHGCVDPDLRYHGLANLSILSASTFPSGSSVGPTLTLAALALRLGDHLGRGRR
jgi:choline dehydrogenase-like flavoprotein